MNRTTLTSRFLILGIAVLAMLVQGCQETPTEPITPEELFSHLNIAMGSTNTGNAAFDGNVIPPGFVTPPLDSQISVNGPNTNVFQPSWAIITDITITADENDAHMNNTYPPFPESIWPDLDVAGGTRFGNMWGVFPDGGDPNNWVAQHWEWLRRPVEINGTTYPFDEKFLASEPCQMCPFGFFVAGPSRHTPDDPLYQRRTTTTWFFYGDWAPFTWPGGETPGPPAPTGPPELTEVHIFITSLVATLVGGTTVTFPDQIGDVELFSINGQPRQIGDSAVPQGEFTDLSFVVDPAQSWVRADGQVADLNFGNATIIVQGPWTVGMGMFTTVTLTIDIEASMSYDEADGSWTFSPVILITVTTG